MSRSLIAVGCNTYDHIRPLSGAEHDASRIASLLIGSGRYDYRTDKSTVLLSPTTSQLRDAVTELYERAPTEVCLYFAGHAESRDGRLYLKLRDTQDSILPATSISAGDLLDLIVQIPSLLQLNVIIDACNAGGLAVDLARVLGERAQKSLGATSISILAGAGPDQPARETPGGGRLTSAITEILSGAVVIQRWSPYFEMSQIAEAISRLPNVASQSPSYWGMNIRGANPLCANPVFDPASAIVASPESYFVGNVPLSAEQLEVVRHFLHRLQAEGYQPELLRPVQKAISSLPDNQQVSVFLGLSETVEFYERDRAQCPPDREIMLAQSLLPLASSGAVKAIFDLQSKRLVSRSVERLIALKGELIVEPRALVKGRSSFGSLFFLPVRVALLLGWIGFCADRTLDEVHLSELKQLSEIVITNYRNVLVAVDDRQASGIFCFVVSALKLGWNDHISAVINKMFIDVLRTHGQVAKYNATAAERLHYLLHRYDAAKLVGIIQKPTELVFALLVFGAIIGKDGEWDKHLFTIDHLSINAYVASSPLLFGEETMIDGRNISMAVGEQFSTLADLRKLIRDLTATDAMIEWSSHPAIDAMSLTLPDRVNWAKLIKYLSSGEIQMFKPHLRISVEDATTGVQTVIYEEPGSA